MQNNNGKDNGNSSGNRLINNYGLAGGSSFYKKNNIVGQYNALFGKYNVNAGFSVFDITNQEEFPILLHFLERFNFKGLNLAAPLQSINSYLEEVDDSALATEVITTILLTKNGWKGFNTILNGITKLLKQNDVKPSESVAVIGAGAIAKTVLKALAHNGNTKITLINRSVANMEKLATSCGADCHNLKEINSAKPHSIIINTIPVDWSNPIWRGHFMPETPFGGYSPRIAMDLSFYPDTRFSQFWDTNIDASAVLAEQTIEVFKLWFGIDLNKPLGIEI